MDQKQLTMLRQAMVERAVEAIQRSNALLARTRELLHQAEARAAKHNRRKPIPLHATGELKA